MKGDGEHRGREGGGEGSPAEATPECRPGGEALRKYPAAAKALRSELLGMFGDQQKKKTTWWPHRERLLWGRGRGLDCRGPCRPLWYFTFLLKMEAIGRS